MSKPYRRSSQHGLLWVIIVFIGIGCGIAAATTLPKDVQWWWGAIVIMTPMFAAMALCVYLVGRIKRRRVSRIQADIERDSFVMDPKPDAARKETVFEPVADLQRRLDLRNGSVGISWLALRAREPASMCIFEHSYFTGSGDTTQEHQHTVIVWWMPHLTLANLSGFRTHWLQRRILSKDDTVVKLGNEAFDKQWLILGDEASAQLFFNDRMRSMLADSPRGESWHTGTGWIACAFDGAMDTRKLAAFRARAEEIVTRSCLTATTRAL